MTNFIATFRVTLHRWQMIIKCATDLIWVINNFLTQQVMYNGKPFYNYQSSIAQVLPPEAFNYQVVLDAIISQRSSMLIKDTDPLRLGQVLEFDIDVSTYDGAPEHASQGFVDGADIPPIDTWFYVTKTHLYCWIPNFFLGIMTEAKEVEILDSYRWVRDARPELQLRMEDYFKSKRA